MAGSPSDNEDGGYKSFYNLNPEGGARPESMPKEMVRVEFARRLNHHILKKGWNQSEFSRQTKIHTPADSKGVTRDLVSKYLQGVTLPSPVNLGIILKTLGIEREDLLPTAAVREAGDLLPPTDVRDAGNGLAWLRVNQAVEWPVALRVLSILKSSKK